MKTKPTVPVSRPSLWHIPLVFLVAMSLVPILFALLYSFKSLQSIFGGAGLFTSGFTLDNYRDIAQQLPIVQITLNTLAVAVLVTACKLLTSILAAYAFVFTSYYNIFTVEGTAASRVFFRIVAKAVRMRESWPDVHLQGPLRPYESQSASLSFAAFDLCRLSRLVRRNCAKFCFRLKPKAARALFLLPLPTKSLILQGPRVCARVIK